MRIIITLVAAITVCPNLFGLFNPGTITHADTLRLLQTRIQVKDTAADIFIPDSPSRVVGTGDFNGDGVDDFLVEYRKVIGVDITLIVFVKFGIIFGKRNQNQPTTINLGTEEPDLSLVTSVKGTIGISDIARLGDLNGDGIDDLVLTQQLSGEPGNRGKRIIKVFFGSARLRPGVIDLDAQQADLTVVTDDRAASAGITGVAEVNADGVRDLLLSENANYIDFALPILLGPFDPGETIDLNTRPPDVIVRANNRIDNINSVFLADINGDATTDMLIKKSRFDERLGIYFTALDVVFGSPHLKPGSEVSLSDGQADATVIAGFDFSVIATGDVNADRIDDILIGIPTYYGEPAPPPWFSGSVRIILGSRSLRGTVNQVDASIEGLSAPNPFQPIFRTTLGDHLGQSIAVSDINGDGVSDILIGAPGLTSDAKGRVRSLNSAHVILGPVGVDGATLIKTAREEQDITISFDVDNSNVGGQVGSGDFNGDGISDILVGGYSSVYVFFGGQLRPPEITKAKYRAASSELSIFGTDFTGLIRVEINGVIVEREVTFEADENKLVVSGGRLDLNLRDGKNRVVVIRKGARSNSVKIKQR